MAISPLASYSILDEVARKIMCQVKCYFLSITKARSQTGNGQNRVLLPAEALCYNNCIRNLYHQEIVALWDSVCLN